MVLHHFLLSINIFFHVTCRKISPQVSEKIRLINSKVCFEQNNKWTLPYNESYWNLIQQDFAILFRFISIFILISNQALSASLGQVWLMWKPCGIWTPHSCDVTDLFSRIWHSVICCVVLETYKALGSFETSGTTYQIAQRYTQNTLRVSVNTVLLAEDCT